MIPVPRPRGVRSDLRTLVASRIRRTRHRDVHPGEGSMVMLVHGHLGHPADLGLLGARAQDRGHSVLALRRSSRQRINAAVAQVSRMLERLPGPVHLVGHSLGGIIVARALLDYPDRVLSIAAIAAPLAGAPLAALKGLRASPVRDLAPGSPALPDLRQLSTMADRVLLVAAEQDPIVPISSALAGGMAASQLIVPAGHLGVLEEEQVLAAVQAHLERHDRQLQRQAGTAPSRE